jgi:hypothetical protein
MLYRHYPDDLFEIIDYEDENIKKVCFKINNFLERVGYKVGKVLGWT